MKRKLFAFEITTISDWPHWFERLIIALILLLLCSLLWYWNPIDAQLREAKSEYLQSERTLSGAIATTPQKSEKIDTASPEPISFLERIFSKNHLSLTLIKPTTDNQISIEAIGRYQNLRQVIYALNQSEVAWSLDSLAINSSQPGILSISIALKPGNSEHKVDFQEHS